VFGAPAGQDQLCAQAREFLGDGSADSCPAARYDGRPTFQRFFG
jgi:hypothetical protein